MNTSDINSELDSFREQWRAEVRARNPAQGQDPSGSGPGPSTAAAQASGALRRPQGSKKPALPHDYDDVYYQARSFDEPTTESSSVVTPEEQDVPVDKEPISALDHYEQAVEKEAAGNLGDSLRLYRKAFRASLLSNTA
jgi:F-box protein 9